MRGMGFSTAHPDSAGPNPSSPTAQRVVGTHDMQHDPARISNDLAAEGVFAFLLQKPATAPPMAILAVGGLFAFFFANNPDR